MRKMEAVESGSEHRLNRELGRLGPGWRSVKLEFWDKDTFSADDLLGRIEIRRDGQGKFTVAAGESAEDLGGGRFRLTGEGGNYLVWLAFEET